MEIYTFFAGKIAILFVIFLGYNFVKEKYFGKKKVIENA